MNIRDVLEFVRHYWVSITVLSVLGALIGGVMLWRETPTYTAASGIFLTVQTTDTSDASTGVTVAASQARSFASVAKSAIVLQPVIDKLRLPMAPRDLGALITTANPADAIITISVDDPDAQRAADIANGVADQLVEVITKLSPTDSSHAPMTIPTVITRAAVPTSPAGFSRTQYLGIGLIAGLLLGLAQALFRRSLDLTRPTVGDDAGAGSVQQDTPGAQVTSGK